MPIPDRIKNAPELHLGLELYLNAWFDLSSERSIGFGEGPIPWSEIELYADRVGMSDDDREDFHFLLRSMEISYFEYREAQRKNA